MRYGYMSFILLLGVMLQVSTACAQQSLCHDFSSDIEPDMQRQETDFTHEAYKFSQQMLETTIPDWMENVFKHNKKFPQTYDNLFQGDIWTAYANHSAVVKGYVLKLEYLSASKQNKETARRQFCKFVTETPYYD